MSDLQTRYQELQASGRVPLYGYRLAIVDNLAKADTVLIQLGYQSTTGRYLYLIDLDSHHAGQNADAARAAIVVALPHIKLTWARSRGKGLHALFESPKQLPTGRLFDASGKHIGELIGG